MRLNRRAILMAVSVSSLFSFVVLVLIKKNDVGEQLLSKSRFHAKKLLSNKKTHVSKDGCFHKATCPLHQILFQIHAETSASPPYACINDRKLFAGKSFESGMSVVYVNGSNGNIESHAFFDVNKSDRELVNWLRSLPDFSIIIGLSLGDIAEMVSADARAIFVSFGAVKIVDWKKASSYAILGQKAVGRPALELVVPQSLQNASQEIESCFELRLGDIPTNFTDSVLSTERTDIGEITSRTKFGSSDNIVQLGSNWSGCGIPGQCNSDEIPMYFYSGEHKDDWPRLCVGGRMVFDRGLNNAGRGLNVVSVEPRSGRVTAVARFDTYQEGSSALEQWLDNRPLGEVIAALSFDEASTMLSDMAKQIFYEMGSSMVQKLRFRASWYFVGHKELAAYTPFEDLNIPSGNAWAKSIKTSICLPKKVESWRGRTSTSYLRPHNLPRRHFCMKHDQHGKFCSESEVDKPILPRPLSNPKRREDPIFRMPIVVAAGLSTESLRICLESLMEQEGLNTKMVVVVYDKEYPENAELSSLFNVKAIPVNATNGYNSLLLSALSTAFDLFPSSPAIAVIEEDVRLSPEWLYYLSQTAPVLLLDKTIDVVQTFNPNGYEDTSGNNSLVYRVQYQPPLFSYVITRTKYEMDIKNNSECCVVPGQWALTTSCSLVPDVSRITVAYSSFGASEWTKFLFSRPRSTFQLSAVLDYSFLTENDYEKTVRSIIKAASRLPFDTITCDLWQRQISTISVMSNSKSVVVHFGSDVSLTFASSCFGLYSDDLFISGVYKQMIRFFNNGTTVFIVPEALFASSSSLPL